MMRKIIPAAVLVLAVATGPAEAQSIPRYDPVSYCETVANTVGGSAQIKATCIEEEQTSYDRLKAQWSTIAGTAASYCDQVARVVGGTYQILETCIAQESTATDTMPGFTY